MNWLDVVLGSNWILVLPAAMIIGVFSGFSKAGVLVGSRKFLVGSDPKRDAFGKTAIVLAFGALIYFDADDLEDVFFRLTVPVGLYKLTQMLSTSFFIWRMEDAGEHLKANAENG